MLLEAKPQVEWLGECHARITNVCKLSVPTTYPYMRLVKKIDVYGFNRATRKTLSDYIDSRPKHHRPAWHEPVRNALNDGLTGPDDVRPRPDLGVYSARNGC
jgi:hypothetical protein